MNRGPSTVDREKHLRFAGVQRTFDFWPDTESQKAQTVIPSCGLGRQTEIVVQIMLRWLPTFLECISFAAAAAWASASASASVAWWAVKCEWEEYFPDIHSPTNPTNHPAIDSFSQPSRNKAIMGHFNNKNMPLLINLQYKRKIKSRFVLLHLAHYHFPSHDMIFMIRFSISIRERHTNVAITIREI